MSSTSIPTALVALLLASQAAGAPAPREVLPFIADDYPNALAAARAEKRPIFLEAWAPW